jgi:hypothetical protein
LQLKKFIVFNSRKCVVVELVRCVVVRLVRVCIVHTKLISAIINFQMSKQLTRAQTAKLNAAITRLSAVINGLFTGEQCAKSLAEVARLAKISPRSFDNNQAFERHRNVAKRYVDRVQSGAALDKLQAVLEDVRSGDRGEPRSVSELCRSAGILAASYYSGSPRATALRKSFRALGVGSVDAKKPVSGKAHGRDGQSD